MAVRIERCGDDQVAAFLHNTGPNDWDLRTSWYSLAANASFHFRFLCLSEIRTAGMSAKFSTRAAKAIRESRRIM